MPPQRKLRYSFRRARFDDYQSGAWVKVQVSGDGGDSWTTLARHKFIRDDAADRSKLHDISDFIGPHTQVRVIGGPAEEVDAYIYLDNFEIELTMAGVAATTTTTTTTTPPTTTTSTSSTTTTATVPSTPTSTTTRTTTTRQRPRGRRPRSLCPTRSNRTHPRLPRRGYEHHDHHDDRRCRGWDRASSP